MAKNLIVGLGEALWDVLPDGKKIGGAPANFAFHASQFGNDAVAVSAVGTDALGDETLAAFDSNGLNYIMPRVDYPTGTVQVTLDEAGVPNYEIKEGVAWDNIPFTPEIEELAKRCDAVCWGSLAQRSEVSRETINKFLACTKDDCLKIFDINLRQHFYCKEVIEASLSKCDVLKINDDELVIVGDMFGIDVTDVDKACDEMLRQFGLKMLVLTCGAVCSHVFTAAGKSHQPTPKVTVADTVGAGDSFTGSFCSAVLNGKPVAHAHALAVKVSAFVCTQNGAMPKLPAEMTDECK